MIPLFWFANCGKVVEEPWEVEVYVAEERTRGPLLSEDGFGDPIVNTQWADKETELSLQIPEGWVGWPGAPGAEVRLHLEHPLSATQLRVYRTSTQRAWPQAETCEWSFEDQGGYSEIRVSAEIEYASCWPRIPGDSRRLAWRFVLNDEVSWLVEARIPGGQAGLAGEAMDVLLPEIRF
jgi:hypothetical protein